MTLVHTEGEVVRGPPLTPQILIHDEDPIFVYVSGGGCPLTENLQSF